MQVSIKDAILKNLSNLKRMINSVIIPMTIGLLCIYLAIICYYIQIIRTKLLLVNLLNHVKADVYENEVK